eukprot:gnl/MRDRNA2_/MRDRNA2_104165_c0_seq1.p1 gnl/MRDRNA2_/MRDRNA2_104165_c0~~gnl/MRDRNA2_/MRDRNA2_104165_c0_seq1.p1  ORF type:complete len:240 (+),score=43.32 gnl/MRDRNA2_/MRDRNA2_104165_c0_seq1:89-808(+)
MTERFYPIGTLKAEDEAFKSTYTMQNEMRSFHRSAYPPGYAGHEPGVRDKFGYAAPGPDPWKLAGPEHALTEDVDNPAPRIMQATTKSKAHDQSDFYHLDLPAYSATLASQASNVLPPDLRTRTMTRSLSSTRMDMKPLSIKKAPIDRLEDDRFTYFVPKTYCQKPRSMLMARQLDLLKLDKQEIVTMANPGEGTGFRCQAGGPGWWPCLDADPEISTIQRAYRRPPFHRSFSATFHTR